MSYAQRMTRATVDERPRLRLVLDTDHAQRHIAAEVRAELARQQVTDSMIAEAMGQNQQWFNRRKNGDVPFSAAELAFVATYLGVPIEQLFGRGIKPVNPSPDDDGAPSGTRTPNPLIQSLGGQLDTIRPTALPLAA